MRALILSGGGVKGSWQVGVLRYLTEVKGLSWDFIAGISVGALNGSFIAQYPKEFQLEGTKNLENIWKQIHGNKSIYKPWFPSKLPSIFGYVMSLWTGGLFSTSPLKKLITKNLNTELLFTSNVKLLIGAVSVTTGKCKFVREYEDKLIDWVVASSAFPVAFPPVKINGDVFIDGGMRKDASPIPYILEHNPTEIDIVTTSPIEGKLINPSNNRMGALGIAIRAVQILNEEAFPTTLVKNCLEKGIKINVYAPKENLKVDLLNFAPEIIEELINKGYNDASKQN